MDEIINYVMDTPGNTNPNILRGMLQNSGSDDFVVINMIMDENFEDVVSVDISREELAAAIEARKRIYIAPCREGDPPPDTWYIVTYNRLNTNGVTVKALNINIFLQTIQYELYQVGWEKKGTSWVADHYAKSK